MYRRKHVCTEVSPSAVSGTSPRIPCRKGGSTVESIILTMLYIRAPGLAHFITGGLYVWPIPPPLSPPTCIWQPPSSCLLLGVLSFKIPQINGNTQYLSLSNFFPLAHALKVHKCFCFYIPQGCWPAVFLQSQGM